jgi:NDP-sugar pyrophosphorylase family protein
VYAWELPGTWYDIGTPEQLEAARDDFDTESAQ